MFFCRQLHVFLLSMVAAAAAVLSICVDADFAYLGLSGVDESAGRLVRLVILKCYECVFVGCSVHSVVDSQLKELARAIYIQQSARKKHHKTLQESTTRDNASNP